MLYIAVDFDFSRLQFPAVVQRIAVDVEESEGPRQCVPGLGMVLLGRQTITWFPAQTVYDFELVVHHESVLKIRPVCEAGQELVEGGP